MPLSVFTHAGATRLGKVIGDHVVDLSIAAPSLPVTTIGFLEAGQEALAAYEGVTLEGPGVLALADVRLEAPIRNPEKFLAIGMNYRKHVLEAIANGIPEQTYQVWFNKQVSCINGPFDDVDLPRVSDWLDYEAEVGVVIGKTCRHVSVEDARSVIGGYLLVNDVSVRDWQIRTPTMTLGKSFDTHGPIGPWLTLNHELADPHALTLRLTVNGELRQEENTGDMIHNIYEQIAYLSTVMTLRPGDILATGTPSGVGAGKTPKVWLVAGDVVRVEAEGLGFIENRIVPEPTV